jgi:hypothetical protein
MRRKTKGKIRSQIILIRGHFLTKMSEDINNLAPLVFVLLSPPRFRGDDDNER